MYSFLFNIVKCINIKIYIIIKIVILSMTDIKISGINKVFEPLQKSGYSIFLKKSSEDEEYKIIYKNDNNNNEETIITNSVIFNTIYSHEINENYVPLVEYYNLLIETISQEPQVVSQSVINYSPPQAQSPFNMQQNSSFQSFTPLQITDGQGSTGNQEFQYTSPQAVSQSVINYLPTSPQAQSPFNMQQNSSFQSFTPLQITDGQGSTGNQEFQYTSPPAIIQQTNTNIKDAKNANAYKFIMDLISKFINDFNNKKNKIKKIILGEYISKKKHNNIENKYKTRYPPNYTGPYFEIHAIDKSKGTLTKNIDDVNTIDKIAIAWNDYITQHITNYEEDFKKEEENFNKLYNILKESNFSKYYADFLNSILDPNNNHSPYDKFRELAVNKYQLPGNNVFYQHVNLYGYPIYRAFYKNIKLFSDYLVDNTTQITDGQAGGMFNKVFTMDGFPLITESDWQKYAIQHKYDNRSHINSPQISSQGASGFNGFQYLSPINPIVSPSPITPITNKYAWNYNNGKITRYNGYYDMEYNRIKKDIFYHNENKNIYIKFFYIFSVEDIKASSNPVTIIIVKTSEYKIEPIIVTSSEKFLIDNIEKLENKIIAKISTNTDIGGDTYILFNVDIIGNIKEAADIYKEEDKYKYDFVNLNNDLKKIIEYYNTINGLTYFRTYGELEKKLKEFKKTYDLNSDNVADLINIYKQELKLRSNICNAILDKSINNNINKYKDLLEYTYNNIDNYPDKKDYTSRIYKLINKLIDRVRYYGENFIY